MIDFTKFYLIIGALIVLNIGTIVSIVFAAFKITWNLSKILTELKSVTDQNTKDTNAAHAKIRDLEKIILANGRN